MPRRSTSSYILAEPRRSSAAFWSLVNSHERALRVGAGVVCVRSGIAVAENRDDVKKNFGAVKGPL